MSRLISYPVGQLRAGAYGLLSLCCQRCRRWVLAEQLAKAASFLVAVCGAQVFKKSDIEDEDILSLSSGVKRGGKKARGRAAERKDDKPVRSGRCGLLHVHVAVSCTDNTHGCVRRATNTA